MHTPRAIRLPVLVVIAAACGFASLAISSHVTVALGDIILGEPVPPITSTGSAPHKQLPAETTLTPDQHEAVFNDDSSLKLKVLDETVELITPYGKLLIPVAHIQMLELATRLTEDENKRLTQAIGALADDDYAKREQASDALAQMGEKAYPELLKVSKGEHTESARRAKTLIDKLREDVSDERLAANGYDIITTAQSRIAGTITQTSLRVTTAQFGELKLKLADVRELRSAAATEREPENVLPDPGNMQSFTNQAGKTLHFRVTGAAQLSSTIYGTGIYTVDGPLAQTAVHAGALKPGETKVIAVKVLGQVASFTGSTQNGFTSSSYSTYNGYEIVLKKKRR